MITQKRSWFRNVVAALAFRLGFDRFGLFALGVRVDGLPAWRARIYRAVGDDDLLVLDYDFDEPPPVDFSDPRVQ